MRLEDRITRRRRRGGKRRRLVRDLSALDPTAHPREPTGRGPTLERILDHLDPVFDGELPPDAHVHGPKGVGKSAVVAALFEHLASALPARRSVIHTATRTAATPTTSFAYVDARDAPTEFALLHAALETLSKEPVPSQGVGVEALRERLTARVAHDEHAVVAVDHVGEPETVSAATAVETLSSVSPHVSVLTVGRDPRSDATEAGDDDDATDVTDAASIAVSAYERHSLVDILVARASDGVARSALPHVATREVAEWADGDAHDALSALYGAATLAAADGADTIDTEYVCAGIDAVPDDGCSLGRVFALPESRRRVLRAFVALDDEETASVSTATEHIAASPRVSLSPATVRRVLYELSDLGIVRRVSDSDSTDGPGRPATRPVPNFSTLAFRGLDDAER
ncbi:Cdc6/Cdc18 family protein [Haloferax volcanii]|uniref:Orc1-type DNA replication protein n=3 Tax=Haloferax volcanii TaxID=2246 RepID=A0A384LAK6_HALVD|nr:AAA family ATPase [Haloferax volcanii]ADE04316.1 Orc1-type DNA replication protein [Haloferax volcanii DS2]ELY35762.1 Orc1-type DNA replication protein [Haloferax volcanii DS2]MBS8119335.1 AAA family ATPase [Haloferax volcanii]MBS8124348.1 AAA family ATPase [Haloferax volcanii]MBS8128217.1 AAA family ATPase [Haloferax volcanii]